MKKIIKRIGYCLVSVLATAVLFSCFACEKKDDGKYLIVEHEYYIKKVNEFKEENTKYTGGVDCVFIGDSWTDGYRPIEEFYPEFTVLNRGIGGDNSYGLLQRLDVSVYAVKPKVTVMLIGGNNMYSCDEDIREIVTEIKRNLPQTKIVMQSMYTISNDGFKDRQGRIKEMCEYFENLSKKYGLTYVDVYSHLVDENGTPIEAYHIEDGVHFNERGYEVITSVLKPVLTELLEKNQKA